MADDNRNLLEMLLSPPQDAMQKGYQGAAQGGASAVNTTMDAGINPIGILSHLIKAGGAIGNIQPNVGGSTQQGVYNAATSMNPYQEGVVKALKKGGEAHTAEALASGVPADHIVQQAGLNQQQNPQQNPQQNTAQPTNAPQPNVNQPNQGFNPTDILKWLINPGGMDKNQVYQPATMLGGLIRQTPQDVLAGQQAASLAQRAMGQEPIQPYEQAQVQGGVNTATIQAMNDANTRLQSYRDQLTKEFTAEGQTIPGWEKGISRQLTPRMKEIQDQLKDINQTQTSLLNSFTGYKPKNILDTIRKVNQTIPRYTIGSTVSVRGKNYKITGFQNGKHTIEEVK